MLQKRESHHSGGGHVNCLEIMDKFIRLPAFNSSKCVLLYASKGGEVHTDGIMQSALSFGKKVCLPLTFKEKKSLEIYEAKSLEELSLGAFGVREPSHQPECRVSPDEVDLVVVPGVSFDRRGHRIGYGMGYYDSLLPKIKGKKIGLAYSFQLVELVPNEPHDVAVDIVVTEKEVINCAASQASNNNGAVFCQAKAAENKGSSSTSPSQTKLRVVVLASGRGTDFQSLIDANAAGGALHGKVELVGLITDNPNAQAIARAKSAGIPPFVIPYSSREELDSKIKQKLDELTPGLVVLAGYMKVIKSKELLSAYSGRIINIHPSLLPSYPGAHAQRDAFEAGEKVSGFTIHFVDESLDGGKIIYQEKADISSCKSADEVAEKILAREHMGLPAVVGMFASGKVPNL